MTNNVSAKQHFNEIDTKTHSQSQSTKALWVSSVALPAIRDKIVSQIKQIPHRIHKQGERNKALLHLHALVENIDALAKSPPSTIDELVRGVFGDEKTLKSLTKLTKENKAERQLFLRYTVIELRDLIVDEYLTSYKSRLSLSNEGVLKDHLNENLFQLAFPKLNQKNLKLEMAEKVAARILLSATGVAGGEDAAAAAESNPRLQRKNVNPATDPALHEASKIHAKIKLYYSALTKGIEQKTISRKEVDYYESEIASLKADLKALNNNVNKTARTVIILSIATASLALLHKVVKNHGSSKLHSINIEPVLAAAAIAAPVIVTGLGTGIHLWNVRNKSHKLQQLKQQESQYQVRSSMLHQLLIEEKEVEGLGLNSAQLTALKKLQCDKEELYEHLMTILSATHGTITEQKEQAKTNLKVAKANLGATSTSLGVSCAAVAGLSCPFTAPAVAALLVIAGASTAYTSYKTQKFDERSSEIKRQEVIFNESTSISLQENSLAKEALLLIAGVSVEQQNKIEALFALHLDNLA